MLKAQIREEIRVNSKHLNLDDQIQVQMAGATVTGKKSNLTGAAA
jgi:hypothetical protein